MLRAAILPFASLLAITTKDTHPNAWHTSFCSRAAAVHEPEREAARAALAGAVAQGPPIPGPAVCAQEV
jgi:hypothetical protein